MIYKTERDFLPYPQESFVPSEKELRDSRARENWRLVIVVYTLGVSSDDRGFHYFWERSDKELAPPVEPAVPPKATLRQRERVPGGGGMKV